jgi:hypothetical protein
MKLGANEIWVCSSVETDREFIIKNATIVPPVGAKIDTRDGQRQVYGHLYDYNEEGDCRIHLFVHKTV